MFEVDRNYMAIEKYINDFDKFYELIVYQPFESINEALVQLNAICNGKFLNEIIKKMS